MSQMNPKEHCILSSTTIHSQSLPLTDFAQKERSLKCLKTLRLRTKND